MTDKVDKFFNLSVDLLCIAGTDGYFKKLNPAWERTLGFSTEELMAKPYLDFIHPDDRASSISVVDHVIQGSPPVDFMNRYRTKSGEYRSLVWRGTLEDGLMYGVARDRTEALKAEEERRQREQQLRSIAQNAPGMLYQFRTDSEGRRSFPYVSARAPEILDMTVEEIRRDAEAVVALVHPEDVAEFSSRMERSRAGLVPFRWEGRMVLRSGQLKWIRAASDPRRLDDGAILWDGIILDITREKEMDALLCDQQAKMAHSSKLASLGKMAGNIAHEINNPLAILKAYANQLQKILLEHSFDSDKAAEFGRRIESTVDRIARIVTGLKLISRDSSPDPLLPCPVPEIVQDTLSLCTDRFQFRQVALEVDPGRKDWVVSCRPTEISQVLLNLLNNAFDAVEQAQDRWVRIQTREATPGWIQIRVMDSGPPIEAAVREKLMTPFFTTKAPGKGTGLGLSISKTIVEAHGGSLRLDPTSASTCFVVTLPRHAFA